MKGILKMLTGQGSREYREQNKKFDDAIPDQPGFDPADHPAVSGPLANTSSAFAYRRANANSGPKSKLEHRQFATLQDARAAYDKEVRYVNPQDRVAFEDWLFGR